MKNKKVVIITGSNRGIGYGITKSFVDEGYIVIVGARQNLSLEKEFGDSVIFMQVDVKKQKDHYKLVNMAIKNYGRLDCYINNAGYSQWRPISKIDENFIDDILDTNLKGAFLGIKSSC